MLLQKENETITTANLGAGNSFTIAASAKAFEVLSSNLYQNKILAVIREITCNAVDAHKAAGRPISEIEVHIPTFVRPHFTVRDFGSGLSKQDVLHLYTTYFQSTKDNSNDLIGGFGLGSKSPFAVADQFTVTSWHGGIKGTYVCYKQNGVPQVNVVSEVPSNERTGLEVMVAARDYVTWAKEANGFFAWWNERPKINIALNTNNFAADNLIMQSPAQVEGYPEWAFLRNVHGSTVLMGRVPYALNIQAIPNMPPDAASFFNNVSVVLSYKVGELSISPSREALSYDPATCAALSKRLADIFKSSMKELQDAIDKQPSLVEARRFVYQDGAANATQSQLLKRLRQVAMNSNGLKWHGKVIRQIEVIGAGDFAGKKFAAVSYTKRVHHKTWQKGYGRDEIRHNICYDEVGKLFYTDNITAKTYRQLQEAGAALAAQHKHVSFMLVTGPTYAELVAKCAEIGLEPPVDMATLPPPAKVMGAGKKSPLTKGYIYDDKAGSFNRAEAEINLTGGGLYLPFFDGEPHNGTDRRRLFCLRNLDLFPRSTPIYGFRQASLSSKTFRDKLAANKVIEANEAWAKTLLTDQLIANYAWNTVIGNAFYGHPRDPWEGAMYFATLFTEREKLEALHAAQPGNLPPLKAWTPIKMDATLEAGLRRWGKLKISHAMTEVVGALFQDVLTPSQLAAKAVAEKEAGEILRLWQSFLAANPLLKSLSWRGYNGKLEYEELAAYINR